jgi:hypothetical protein
MPSAALELRAPLNVPIEMLANDERGSAAAWSGVLTGATTIELDLESAVVRGLVVDDTGEPMRSFELTGAILSPLASCQSAFRRGVVTDDGRFEIAIPRGGRATFGARCVLEDGTIASTDGDVTASDGEREVLVRVQAHASVAGLVLDPAGTPVRGADVDVQWSRSADADGPGGALRGCITGVTDDAGKFAVTGVPPGTARILVRGQPDTERALTLAPREHRDGLVLRL